MRQFLRSALAILSLIYILTRFLPCALQSQYLAGNAVDSSWSQAYHIDFLQHAQWGKDVIFTYGPWSIITRGYNPGTHLLVTAIWACLALIFWRSLYRTVTHFTNHLGGQAFFLFAFPAFCSIPVGDDFDSRIVAWSLLLLISYLFIDREKTSIDSLLLVLSLSLFSLAKFTGFIGAFTIIGLIGINDLFRKRVPIIPITASAGLVAFWILAGQAINNLPIFLKTSFQVASGYTEAMMIHTIGEGTRALTYIAISAVIVLIITIALWRSNRSAAVIFPMGIAALLFLSFKHGYVRSDTHEALAVTCLMLVLISTLIITSRSSKIMQVALICMFLMSTCITTRAFRDCFGNQGLGLQLCDTIRLETLTAPLHVEFDNSLFEEFTADKIKLRRTITLPDLKCSADLYTWYLSGLFAYNFHYQPRPINQGYSAYTPELIKANVDSLTVPNAPTLIAFQPVSLDHRYPSLDDGAAWPELLSRYEIVETTNKFPIILLKAKVPGSYRFKDIASLSVQAEQNIILPTNKLLWVYINIQPTLMGRLMTIFYKPSYVLMNVSLSDGSNRVFQLIPGMAKAGFLLSPFVNDCPSFKDLGKNPGNAVKSISISEMAGRFPNYKDTYQVDLKQLILEKPAGQ